MPDENARPDYDEDLGGDPACWLNRVCPECGLFIEDRSAVACPRCESALPSD
ncbi:hypothetical protein [Tomitella fengzijianii]|uniref:hypothetical protein n=1 Tax=Tomitella fengzijianii TaxID=2597660 RepID=UPI00143D8C83|nr:hypothetical protein [Tomitella fengzijianii]